MTYPTLITQFADATRAHEREGGRGEAYHNYRMARSELAIRFHRALEILQRAVDEEAAYQRGERVSGSWVDDARRVLEKEKP